MAKKKVSSWKGPGRMTKTITERKPMRVTKTMKTKVPKKITPKKGYVKR